MVITSSNINSPYLIDAKKVVAAQDQDFNDFDRSQAYEYARKLNFDLTKIPSKIIDMISKSPGISYLFSQGVNFDLTKKACPLPNGSRIV